MVFQCVYCHGDIEKFPILCFDCHDAMWCSEKCQKHDIIMHKKWCTNQCDIFSKSLSVRSERVPIGLVRFACRICHNDYNKAWLILKSQGVVKSDTFISDALSGPEIIEIHNHM